MKIEATEQAELTQRSGEIRCPEDIVREIADRRFEDTFGSEVTSAVKSEIRENNDQFENSEDFEKSAAKAGIPNPESILGYVERPDEPAHIRDGPVPVEIATKIHEDIHRATHPETMREASSSPEMQKLYEGITEYLTQKSLEGLHGNVSDCCYQSEVGEAEKLAAEVSDVRLEGYLFRHEMADEIENTIRRLRERQESS